MTLYKPFLKWVGGKTQLLGNILPYIPENINNYHEPFVGGGSVLLAILSLQQEKKLAITGKIYAYDFNERLILLYKSIQSNVEQFNEHLTEIVSTYDKLNGTKIIRSPITYEESLTSKESYYYWIRQKFNTIDKYSLESSAIFLFLNKTCFRGLYREGPNGFNVPYGHYKTTPTFDTQYLHQISHLIQNVEFKCMDFVESLQNINHDDFVYLDPPYVPIDKKSFTQYNRHGFNRHQELFEYILKLSSKFIMSNSHTDIVLEIFRNYHIEPIVARRTINSKTPNSTELEVIVRNFE